MGVGIGTKSLVLNFMFKVILEQQELLILYFFEGQKDGVGVTTRIYNNSNTTYIDGWVGIVLRANQIGGSGGSIVLGVPNEGLRVISNGNVGLSNSSPQKTHVAGRIMADTDNSEVDVSVEKILKYLIKVQVVIGFDLVALFGAIKQGGYVIIEITGWQKI